MDDAALTKILCSELGTIPGWAWSESPGQYPVDQVGVFYGAIGTAPDRAVGVRVYGDSSNRLEHVQARRVQLRIRGERGAPAGADILAGAAFDLMSSLSRVRGINDVSRQSMTPVGADDNRREERTENYIIILDNQEAE